MDLFENYQRNSKFYELLQNLEKFHSIFYAIADVGYPVFDESIPTACIRFDDFGQAIQFCFNPHFWDKLDDLNRQFIICHECLHVILGHGRRIVDTDNGLLCNYALDIVVNHMLTSKFGFDRNLITNWEKYCWIDTLFKDTSKVDANRSFEYYYSLLQTNNSNGFGAITIDIHDSLESFNADGVEKVLGGSISGKLGKNEIEDFVKKVDNSKMDSNASFGKGHPGEPLIAGELVKILKKMTTVYKKKWESIIKTWESRAIEFADEEQWTHKSRRMSVLDDSLMLPTEYEVETYSKNKLDVFFYLDDSGSCWHLADRFFAAAMSLNPKKFNVRLFTRSTVVRELDPKNPIIKGGGSDDFRCIERHIQKELSDGKIAKYPAAVFHVTDGYDCSGVLVVPQKPHRWYTFLSDTGTDRWLPKGSHIHYLKDFE